MKRRVGEEWERGRVRATERAGETLETWESEKQGSRKLLCIHVVAGKRRLHLDIIDSHQLLKGHQSQLALRLPRGC